MHSNLQRSAFNAAVLASIQDKSPDYLQPFEEIIEDMAKAVVQSAWNPLREIQWHDMSFDQFLETWQEELKQFVDAGCVGALPGAIALEQFLSEEIVAYNTVDIQNEVESASYRGSTVAYVVRSLARQVSKRATARSEFSIRDHLLTGVRDRVEAIWLEEAVAAGIPCGVRAELCFVPNWDGHSIDEMIERCALRSRHYRLRDFCDLLPTEQMTRALQFLGISSAAFIKTVAKRDEDDGKALRKAWKGYSVKPRPRQAPVISADDFVSVVNESGTHTPVLMVHAEIELRELLKWDPSKPMRWVTKDGKVHIGQHDVVNGAGYMDMFQGEVTIPARSTGFGWDGRWSYGINKTYGLYRPAFYATPVFQTVKGH